MVERTVPTNWSKDQPLPTLEEARQAIREGMEMLDRLLKESEKKLPHSDPILPKSQFTI